MIHDSPGNDMMARERPLARCPDLACRRAGVCRQELIGAPCLRTHEPADDWRDRLSNYLEREVKKARVRGDTPLTGFAFELALARFKAGLEERDREWLVEKGK